MAVNGLVGRGVLGGCLALASGCVTDGLRTNVDDRVTTGMVWRQVNGRLGPIKAKMMMSAAELRIRQFRRADVDSYWRLQFCFKDREANNDFLGADVGGDFASLGWGINYFPFNDFGRPVGGRALGVDFGFEVYRAEYEIVWWGGPLAGRVPDRLSGAGAYLGLVGEVLFVEPINGHLVWGAGYNLTETWAREAAVDLDGPYAFLAWRFAVGGK